MAPATFIDSGTALSNTPTSGSGGKLGDLDGDGDLDLFVTTENSDPNRVWLNDGSGNFTLSGNSIGNSVSVDVDLGDLDGGR